VTDEPLAERVSALEERFADLLARFEPAAGAGDAARPPAGDMFWALHGLQERIGDDESGAVLYTGSVGLPTGEHYDWQLGTAVEELLADDWTDSAATLSALGHPVRLLLLRRVLAGVRTAADLASDEGLGTTGQLYHHLRQLVSAGWLRSANRGQYSVPGERVVPLLVILAGAKQ
jgi:DNA-binding transcriptional ArsR family regulator